MTRSPFDHDAVDAAWTTLVRDDAASTPPAELEARVFAAVHASDALLPRSPRWVWPSVAMAAAAVAIAIVLGRGPDRGEPRSGAAGGIDVDMTEEAPLANTVPAPLITLAEPLASAESLQIVRVRMPRAALGFLGIALAAPDTATLVEVDVLVGHDGVARDIRRVQPVGGAFPD